MVATVSSFLGAAFFSQAKSSSASAASAAIRGVRDEILAIMECPLWKGENKESRPFSGGPGGFFPGGGGR
ncbi:hypothetical protein D3C83_267200 [compost metagenome]